MVAALQRRFPGIAAPHKEDICYATTNRQDAVKAIAETADLVLVIGSPKSSNSVRLVEVAKRAGAKTAQLVASADGVDWRWFDGVARVGVTAGASAPEDLVEALIAAIAARFAATVEEIVVTREDVAFKLPRVLVE
jgi:4-hydroxy-3-methylbut-2-enyl diphosphate reductase